MLRKYGFIIILTLVFGVSFLFSDDAQVGTDVSQQETAAPQENAFPPQAILVAAYLGNETTVRQILATSPNKDIRDDYGDTALHLAMFQPNINVVKLLLDYGFDPNAKIAKNGYTPLFDAVAANNVAAARLLLQYGANKNIRARDGQTPLDKAKKEEKRELVLLLYK